MYLYCCLSLPIWEDASPESRQQRTSQCTQHARLSETSNAKVPAIVLAWLTLITWSTWQNSKLPMAQWMWYPSMKRIPGQVVKVKWSKRVCVCMCLRLYMCSRTFQWHVASGKPFQWLRMPVCLCTSITGLEQKFGYFQQMELTILNASTKLGMNIEFPSDYLTGSMFDISSKIQSKWSDEMLEVGMIFLQN